ncbi:hypothetical protein [Thioalkalivibrio sp. XN8]|uniref:hypothetical protein n=1 Tax=Thioalkalivibrio sp. XN8 TaxID=2712863 RepID=UPI0013EC28DF|nr:hypothetical protein [Thioalkalivibrio sp. XN8]NGP53167.1 hypothetical protein [Thioalkalivibrio sp. XN8]
MADATLNSPGAGFSLLGGPLHRLASRAGLVRHGNNTVLVGVVLGLVPWLIGVLLAAAEGHLAQLFSVEVIGAHVRLLVAIPLFFLCETIFDPQLGRFARYCRRTGLLTAEALAAFETRLARIMRWRDAWVPEVVCLAAAVLLALASPSTPWGGVTSGPAAEGAASLAWWWWVVGLALFRFLLFRWIWRFALWCYLLWHLSWLDLRLMPAHADGCGGLAILGDVQLHLLPLVVAISAVLSASFAEDIVAGRVPLELMYVAFVAILLGASLLLLGPLAVFAPRLWACRQQGLHDHMELAAQYASAFQRKWFDADTSMDEALLGSADIQTLADLSTSVTIVRNMRLLPIGPRMLWSLAGSTLLPMLPLLALEYPLATMIDQIVNRLIGL